MGGSSIEFPDIYSLADGRGGHHPRSDKRRDPTMIGYRNKTPFPTMLGALEKPTLYYSTSQSVVRRASREGLFALLGTQTPAGMERFWELRRPQVAPHGTGPTWAK